MTAANIDWTAHEANIHGAVNHYRLHGTTSLYTDGIYIFNDVKHIFNDVKHIFNVGKYIFNDGK